MLYALTGVTGLLAGEAEGDDYALIRYAGLLGAHPRSALSLQTLLVDALQGPPVEIVSCLPRRVAIPLDQRLQLGREEMPLGRNSFLGQEVTDIQGKFRVRIGPLTQKRFRSLLQGSPEWERLQRLVERFLLDPLEFDFEFILARGETRHARLGGEEWSRLGLDTVLFTGRYSGELRPIFAAAV
jgi:type VI secretion system protein ImpH